MCPGSSRAKAPELIDRLQIPLDEYPRRCIAQIEAWDEMKKLLLAEESLPHERGEEYASYIFGAIETGKPYTFGGNVLNKGLITNLPNNCCVEVLCVADRSASTLRTSAICRPVRCSHPTKSMCRN